jgi:hypothetical protein
MDTRRRSVVVVASRPRFAASARFAASLSSGVTVAWLQQNHRRRRRSARGELATAEAAEQQVRAWQRRIRSRSWPRSWR